MSHAHGALLRDVTDTVTEVRLLGEISSLLVVPTEEVNEWMCRAREPEHSPQFNVAAVLNNTSLYLDGT